MDPMDRTGLLYCYCCRESPCTARHRRRRPGIPEAWAPAPMVPVMVRALVLKVFVT